MMIGHYNSIKNASRKKRVYYLYHYVGGSSDIDIDLSRSHGPQIDLISILNCVFNERQLLITVVNVMLYAQLDFSVFFKRKHQTCIIF